MKRATPTRWYSYLNMLKSLKAAKSVILTQSLELQDCNLEYEITNEDSWNNFDQIIDVLEPLCNCIAISEKRQSSLGEAVGSILQFGNFIMQADLRNPVIFAAASSYITYFNPNKIGDNEYDLLLATYLLDPKFTLNYITEEGRVRALRAILNVASISGINLDENRNCFISVFSSYCNFNSSYHQHEDLDTKSALVYWRSKAESGLFQQIAIRLALLKPSSTDIERAFSTLKYIQGSWRYNLSIENLTILARIKIGLLDKNYESDCIGDDINILELHETSLDLEENIDAGQLEDDRITYLIGQHFHGSINNTADCANRDRLLRIYTKLKSIIDFRIVNKKVVPHESVIEHPEVIDSILTEYSRLNRSNYLDSDILAEDTTNSEVNPS